MTGPDPAVPPARTTPDATRAAASHALPGGVDLVHRGEDGGWWPALLWRPGLGWRAVSSTLVGGGLRPVHWVLNAQVRPGYDRLDPAEHLLAMAADLGVDGAGVAMMTAAEVTRWTHAVDGGVRVVVTCGVGVPTWAAAPGPGSETQQVGTINIMAAVPAPLSDAALVNAVGTVTEAKVQALLEAGYACTGTASDALCVAAREPSSGILSDPGDRGAPIEPFGGPRSRWGARLARAVHAAVLEGSLADRRRRAAVADGRRSAGGRPPAGRGRGQGAPGEAG